MEKNPVFEMAVDFVNNTSRHIFLTGKAGTGKTTFLKYIREHTPKKSVVVAPTGVAAINAGGVTMHSFFQLPLGPYIPTGYSSGDKNATDRHTLFRNIKFSQDKRELIRDLQLLIIDEVSMVRSDTLDAMDAILRYFRRKPDTPFGGVQVLFIGDLFQLPPVMPENEWSILKDYYQSEFFFHSKAVEQTSPVYIELKKIYRQNEQTFIDILNKIRNNAIQDSDLQTLHERYNVTPKQSVNYITLTSHNHKADKINTEELKKLQGKLYEFQGTIEGDFPDRTLPTEVSLQLKEGAQIMFIRNDKTEDRRYFNGKLATVKAIEEEEILVTLAGSGDELWLEKETWNNIRYSYNKSEDRIDEEKLGSFTQFPVRLAWAITIHKSQGLTFEHAIIDAGDSFAPGQVYVALSRCTSLEGLILRSKINSKSIHTDEHVISFSNAEANFETLENILDEEKRNFLNASLRETFDFNRLTDLLEEFATYVPERKIPDVQTAVSFARAMLTKTKELQQVAFKFQLQLDDLFLEASDLNLKTRVVKAIEYFSQQIAHYILKPLDEHVDSLKNAKKVRKYVKHVKNVRHLVARKAEEIQQVRYRDVAFDASKIEIDLRRGETAIKKKSKTEKGDSLKETLALFRAGNNISEIAGKRGLAESTVEGHLALLVKSGDLDILEVVKPERKKQIEDTVTQINTPSITAVKQKLGNDFSYGEIRSVMNYLEMLKNASSQKVIESDSSSFEPSRA